MSTDKSQALRDFNQLRVLAALGEMSDPDTGRLPDGWPQVLSKAVNLPEYNAVQVAIPHGAVESVNPFTWRLTDAGRVLCKYAGGLREAMILGPAMKEIAWLNQFYEADPSGARAIEDALRAKRLKAHTLLDAWAEGDEAEQKETLAVLKGADKPKVEFPEDVLRLKGAIPELEALQDHVVEALYSYWSQEFYAAGWMTLGPHSEAVGRFADWFRGIPRAWKPG